MYIVPMNSFAEVEKRYNDTRPVLSKNHSKADDVRPIGKRSRKWERIIKIDENCYVLSDGQLHDPVFYWGYSDSLLSQFPVTNEEIAASAPIVWRRHPDGVETVTIRNGAGDWQNNQRYSFLNRALPGGLWFGTESRKSAKYIRTYSEGYHLPKTKTVPRVYIERARASNGAVQASVLSWATTEDDGLSLTFKRVGVREWEIVGRAPAREIVRQRVDTNKKKELKPYIDKLREWALVTYPMMRTSVAGYQFSRERNKEISEWLRSKGVVNNRVTVWGDIMNGVPLDLTLEILKDEAHELRFHLGCSAMEAIHRAGSEDKVLTYFNTWANRIFGLVNNVVEMKD